ncbi:MAG: UxaA family hydrolase [Chloroflexota bacterium]|nr:UxaA family hydrolase [Chloroflexota bacterium]MDE2908824.1 UxaA family hydrolase [Chloroflexota bacterium]
MHHLNEVGRLPIPSDNCAIAIRDLAAGSAVEHDGKRFKLSHHVLEGHRFAIRRIESGERLTSWGQRFGIALRPIEPGEYVINEAVQVELARRELDFAIPREPNFDNMISAYEFDEAAFKPAPAMTRYDDIRSFNGYARSGGRGVGTRNMIVVLGTSSLVAGFVRTLTQLTASQADGYDNVDGIVPIAHTEGGHRDPNNREVLLRALAGFMVHPNVGAVAAIDFGGEAITNADLRDYMLDNAYPLDHVTHCFQSLSTSFEANVGWFKSLLAEWLPLVNRVERSPQPLSELKIALQCGGSDSFSGISGNPLAAWVAKEVISYGGSANLAETDELIGAESYLLDKVERVESARKFLGMVERFKERVGWHGETAEGNPSGGNKYRGLYNIYLKSLGAAAKRHPDVPLHDVIDYGQRMTSGGFYFMDSPGNDLESIAGQVASGSNMIFFVTGNGSITNFPFAPTIKFVTTTARFELLRQDMDVNAGEYLDGSPLDELGARAFDLTLAVANGQPSAGEKAGHHQVQIWRDWQQTRPANVTLLAQRSYTGEPIAIPDVVDLPPVRIPAYDVDGEWTTERIGLIMPTSLCSGQIAKMTTDSLNAEERGREAGLSRFATLVHTEGCGGNVVPEYKDMQIGYLQHPKLRHALLLEHGCEITHNSYFRAMMAERGLDPDHFGWASIQLDGGIDAVMRKIVGWFSERLRDDAPPPLTTAGLDALRLGLLTQVKPPAYVARGLALLCQVIVAGGGTVVASDKDALFESPFAAQLDLARAPAASLGYGQRAKRAGFHIMANPRAHWGETLAGLGASGVEVMLGYVDGHLLAGHPLAPVLQVSGGAASPEDLDCVLAADDDISGRLLGLLVATLSGEHTPKHQAVGNNDFQVTRGVLGVSF